MFLKLDLFSSSGEVPTLLGPFETLTSDPVIEVASL
jgi:hypothetical protein